MPDLVDIVAISNVNYERPQDSEWYAAKEVPRHLSPCMLEALNKTHSGENATLFFKIVQSAYKLVNYDPNS